MGLGVYKDVKRAVLIDRIKSQEGGVYFCFALPYVQFSCCISFLSTLILASNNVLHNRIIM